MKRIATIFGTRPEAIKLCPLVLALNEHPRLAPHVCVTGQHREMLDQVMSAFGIEPDVDLDLMRPNQTLGGLTARAIEALDKYLAEHRPDLVIVQGDTTTVFCAAMASFYHRIPVGHVEAGLRTGDRFSPYPEEINRVLTSRLTDLHFAPTERSRQNLLREGVADDRILVTGNTVIDALAIALKKVRADPPSIPGLPPEVTNHESTVPLVLITGHRRENFGTGFENICQAIADLARRFPETQFVYPVHLNPNVREPVNRLLRGAANGHDHGYGEPSSLQNDRPASPNVHLIEPLDYLPFVAMMDRATLVLTDSGGVQEEAPSLGKPVLVMRDTTERPEAVEMGTVRLVGTDRQAIVEGVSTLLTDRSAYAEMANAVNPYGDGRACERILSACEAFFGLSGSRVTPVT